MARTPPPPLLALRAAISSQDLDALCACFAPDYRNETPAHPARSFHGREQVRRNWTTILASVPDLTAELVGWSGGEGEPLWAEWNWSGTRSDGAAVHLAGVTVLGLEGGDGDGAGGGDGNREVIRWARFYMEPVDDSDNDAGIGRAVGRRPERSPRGAVMTAGTVQTTHPPEALMRHLVNPVMRALLRSPLARWTGPLVLLEVVGRRSGRRLRIPVVGHWVDGVLNVSSDGRWTANFQGGAGLHVVHRGRRWAARGILLEDPRATVGVLRAALGTSSPRSMGLSGVPASHQITDEEWLRLRRVVRITADGPDVPEPSAPAS